MEHMHCLFWIKDVPIIGISTPQEVLDFIAKKICCKLPAAVDDSEMHRLVKRYQQHVCKNYCLRKRKNKGKVCRFAFPRDVRSTAILYDLESTVAAKYLSVILPITVHFLHNVNYTGWPKKQFTSYFFTFPYKNVHNFCAIFMQIHSLKKNV